MPTRNTIAFTALITFMFLGLVRPVQAAPPAGDTPVKIAILPFSMHTPPDLVYLQSGVRDMLASRLAWQGKVQVVDRVETERAVKGAKDISLDEAVRIGSGLRADYVLFGSITGMGKSVSIDAKMAPISGKGEPVSFYVQTKTLDEVIPQVNRFAQNINQKVFGKPGEKTQNEAEAEALATQNPELLLPSALIAGDRISYLNPNFIEVTPDGQVRQPGLWRSQTFNFGIYAMDTGDLDGDGRDEIVAMTPRKLTVFKKEIQGLRTMATYEAGPLDHFLWVCVSSGADGRKYIFVSNLFRRNSSTAVNANVQYEENAGEDVSSLVFSYSTGKLQVVADKIPYFLNTVYLGKRGKVLVGQQKGDSRESAFKGDIMEMLFSGSSLRPTIPVNVPTGKCNVFNFAKADINNDHMDEILVINEEHRLAVLNPAGDQIWRSRNTFAATTNTFQAVVEDLRFNRVDLYFIPSPIQVVDLNKDGILELVLNRITSSFDQWLPDSMKTYDQGEVVSLSWDQLGMVENWKTRELNGMITGVRLASLNGDGKQQLVISMLLAKDIMKLKQAQSTIITYDLNVSTAPHKKDATTTVSSNQENPERQKIAVPGRSTPKK